MSTNTHSPIKLTEVQTNMEAAMIVAALEAHGIESHLTGEYTSEFRAECPGHVDVLVKVADLAKAQLVLSEFGKQETLDSAGEEEHSARSFRKLFRITVVVGLIGFLLLLANSLVETF